MQPVFDKLRAEYDFIIIDGAPVLGMSDALIFGQYSDGAILSVRRDHSQMPKIYQAAELLRGVGIRMIGCGRQRRPGQGGRPHHPVAADRPESRSSSSSRPDSGPAELAPAEPGVRKHGTGLPRRQSGAVFLRHFDVTS